MLAEMDALDVQAEMEQLRVLGNLTSLERLEQQHGMTLYEAEQTRCPRKKAGRVVRVRLKKLLERHPVTIEKLMDRTDPEDLIFPALSIVYEAHQSTIRKAVELHSRKTSLAVKRAHGTQPHNRHYLKPEVVIEDIRAARC